MATVGVSGEKLNEKEIESDELVPKSNSTGSVIWLWYGFSKEDVEQNTVICKTCRKPIAKNVAI